MYHGIIVVRKEAGYTSHDVVAKIRGICGQKKVGHTGTLDPDATGVLPICLGKGTKVSGMLTDSDKEYETTFLLGVTTDTQDMSGKIIKRHEVVLTEDRVKDVIKSFVGNISQIPPMYSALKVDGKKLCDLARQGIEVERKSRNIQIYGIEIVYIDLPRVCMRVSCSKGTYIRTLCNDIGEKLGCGAAMETLLRTRAAGFTLEDAHTLDELQKAKQENTLPLLVKPIDEVYQCYEKVIALEKAQKLLYNGNAIAEVMVQQPASKQEMVRMYTHKEEFVGIFSYRKEQKMYQPVKMFLQGE
ncbi:MAG: tRNA pseudouridine(55) synthase TruB [Lachnospiraceae bacterium]|jgi:tRNA pseudouridine55 synthase|nr:tRNA pseudouridine(55) synthase TruB [Lachnospiraceae bacterium]